MSFLASRKLAVPACSSRTCAAPPSSVRCMRQGARSNAAIRTIVRATPNLGAQFVDAIVPQAAPHDSLLKDGSSFFWDLMEQVGSDSSNTWLQSVKQSVSALPDVPALVKQQVATLVARIDDLSSVVPTDMRSLSSDLPARLSSFSTSLGAHDGPAGAWAALNSAATDLWSSLQGAAMASTIAPAPLRLASVDPSQLFHGGMVASMPPGQLAALAATALAAMVVSSVQTGTSEAPLLATDQELPTEYDQQSIYRYWSTRPVTLAKRSLQTSVLAVGVLFGLLLDKQTGQEKANEKQRARALRIAIDQLGPAYIKVAQALSTRVDILSPAYFEEITLLQDRVQPFDNAEAMSILQAELGRPISEVFSEISPNPVAAASLGQVYKATLRSSGAEVAVKVQRPGVLEMVALDLVLMRRGIQLVGKFFPNVARSDGILPVLDEWAFKFFREMDYRKEAATMLQFKQDLASLEGIVVPDAYADYTTRRVIVTQWIAGEKLSESRAEDVRELCTTLLNAYLIQLLDTGLLHADPHPGNLIRTPDGKICILDYGLVTEVPANLRVGLLEYMFHLSVKDWAALGDDFVTLQFVTEDSVNPNEVPGLMASVGALMEILMAGGGAVNIDPKKTRELVDMVGLDPADLEDGGFMQGFASVLDTLSNPGQNKSVDMERAAKIQLLQEKVRFRLPPYFVLILRAFSVIEGIALKVDPNYSIINETFPYLSRRMLTDDNEAVRKALRQVLYGDGQRINLERFRTLFDSVRTYTTDGLAAPTVAASRVSTLESAPSTSGSPALDKNTIAALQSIMNPSGNYIQELLIAELAATLESLSRGAAVALLQAGLQSALTRGTLEVLERLGPLRALLFPYPLPAEIISRLGTVVTLTEEDQVAIANFRTLWDLVRPQLESELGSRNLRISLLRSFSSSVSELPRTTQVDLLQGANRTSVLVLQQVLQRTAGRVAKDVETYRQQRAEVGTVLPADALLTPLLSMLQTRP